MNFLEQKLTKLGLSGLEARLYVGLLQRQLTTAGILAKHLKIKRSTVYTILDSLQEKGLISVTQIEAVKHYQANPPKRLKDFLDQQKQELKAKELLLNEMDKDLDSLFSNQLIQPKITIYEGEKGVYSLLMKNLDDQPKEILVLGQYFDDEDKIDFYTDRRIQMKIHTKAIVPDTKFARNMSKLDKSSHRKSYLLDKQHRFPASIHIYDQSVAIFTVSSKDPVGLYIENADICTTLRMVFQLLEKNFSK